jgi:hypothetical protein
MTNSFIERGRELAANPLLQRSVPPGSATPILDRFRELIDQCPDPLGRALAAEGVRLRKAAVEPIAILQLEREPVPTQKRKEEKPMSCRSIFDSAKGSDGAAAVNLGRLGDPKTLLPAWLIVNEARLWKEGMPGAIQLGTHPDTQESALVLFACQEHAQAFLDRNDVAGDRPLAISSLALFMVTIHQLIREGLRHVVRHLPNNPTSPYWVCDAKEFLEGVTAYAKSLLPSSNT